MCESNKNPCSASRKNITQGKNLACLLEAKAKKIGHPAPFPEELVDRFINLYSYKDELILDPFMGSGTTALAALNSNRKYVGYEINKEYCDYIKWTNAYILFV